MHTHTHTRTHTQMHDASVGSFLAPLHTTSSCSQSSWLLPSRCLKCRADEGGSGQQRAERRPTPGLLTDRSLIRLDKLGSLRGGAHSPFTRLIYYTHQEPSTHINTHHAMSRVHTHFSLLFIYPGNINPFFLTRTTSSILSDQQKPRQVTG